MPTTLVAGATGYLGRHLVTELHERGYKVAAIVRDRSRAARTGKCCSPSLSNKVDHWLIGDVTDPEFVANVTQGVDHVISALGVTSQNTDHWQIDYEANLALLRSALNHEVQSFMYTNALGADECPAQLTRAKSAFADALSLSPIKSLVVNPSGYFSDIMAMAKLAKRGILPYLNPSVRLNPIHGADLAAGMINKLEDGTTGTWDVGGPQIFTWPELAEELFAAVGREGRVVRIPGLVPPVLQRVATVFSPRIADSMKFGFWTLANDAVGEAIGSRRIGDFVRSELC